MPRFDILDSSLGNRSDAFAGAALLGFTLDAADSAGRSVADRLSDYVSVKDFGAVGDGWTDDTGAFQAAIDYTKTSRHALYVPPGTYMISSPLVLNRTPTVMHTGFTIVGAPGKAPTWRSSAMPSVLKCTASFPAGESLLDLRYSRRTRVEDLGLDGNLALDASNNPEANGIQWGDPTTGESPLAYSQHHIQGCNLYKFYRGMWGSDGGVLKILYNGVYDCHYMGIAIERWAGDNELVGNIVAETQRTYRGTDLGTGAGIYLAHNGGNTNIRGGKVEWNAKGILIWGSVGVSIVGVQFDSNTWYHIGVAPEEGVGAGVKDGVKAYGTVITGNMFVAGGWYAGDPATALWGGAAVHIKAGLNYWASAAIAGNSFHYGTKATDWTEAPDVMQSTTVGTGGAAINSTTILLTSATGFSYKGSVKISGTKISYNGISGNTLQNCTDHPAYAAGVAVDDFNVGPSYAAVKLDGGGNIKVAIAGNDMWDCAYTYDPPTPTNPLVLKYSVMAEGSGTPGEEQNLHVYLGANATNLPYYKVNNGAQFYTSKYGSLCLETYGTAAPTVGTWAVGDRVINTAPAAGGWFGWVCITAGTPGGWKGWGAVQV